MGEDYVKVGAMGWALDGFQITTSTSVLVSAPHLCTDMHIHLVRFDLDDRFGSFSIKQITPYLFVFYSTITVSPSP